MFMGLRDTSRLSMVRARLNTSGNLSHVGVNACRTILEAGAGEKMTNKTFWMIEKNIDGNPFWWVRRYGQDKYWDTSKRWTQDLTKARHYESKAEAEFFMGRDMVGCMITEHSWIETEDAPAKNKESAGTSTNSVSREMPGWKTVLKYLKAAPLSPENVLFGNVTEHYAKLTYDYIARHFGQ